ncbi:complex BMI-1-like [Octopus vulgaris]|uniref:Complex BMI-1-like n=2 Tax=Octopus TaxID=6643 RepID=A0AA36B3L8_OCTVU|nr:complex BMI-1-like [Octopus vulgaris]
MKRQKQSGTAGKVSAFSTTHSQNSGPHTTIARAKAYGLMLHRNTRIGIADVNPYLNCILCGGYYIDATTIIECLHSFCRTCIVRYLESSKFCPICDVMVHKTKPLQNIRPDNTLQNLVYKLVPSLFKDEMKRRRTLYLSLSADEIENYYVEATGEDCGEMTDERIIYTDDEQFSVSLELTPNGQPPDVDFDPLSDTRKPEDRRYLSCPATFPVKHIKRFIRIKHSLPEKYQIEIYHTDEPLVDNYTLIDIAYIYMWKRVHFDYFIQFHMNQLRNEK